MIQNPNRDGLERFVLTVKSQNEKYDPADPSVTMLIIFLICQRVKEMR